MVEALARLLARETAPATEPIALEDAKLYLRLDSDAEDGILEDIISAVREAAEEYLHQSLITQSWSVTYDDYAPACTPLPMGPVIGITSVESIDRAGDETTIDSDIYALNARRDALVFDSVVLGHKVKITYQTGYGDAEDVPAAIRHGMTIHIAALYDDRIGGMAIPAGVLSLYDLYRTMRLA